MSNYISTASNTQAATADLLAKIKSPTDIIAIVRMPTEWRLLPPVVLKAAADYELDQLKAALYTYLEIP